ncbi:MAG TPA: amidohydrolase family protein [Verrucomicrobiae bacterium]|nr:amidohydrolase family protein [Verrucomicrobiae bacterium]
MMKSLAALLSLTFAASHAAEPILRPPGYRPRSPGLEAITASTVYIDPTNHISPGTIVIRDGLIAAVGANVEIPAGARVWNLTNRTVYAGFIDAAVSLKSTNVARGLVSSSTHFFGVDNKATEQIGLESRRVTPHRRALEGYAPDEKERDSMRELGFTAGNVLGDRGIFRGSSGVVLFSDENPNAAVLKDGTFQFVSFESGGADAGYPSSLMGTLALIRQTFYDARFYNSHPEAEFQPALAALKDGATFLFEPRSTLMVDQATRIAKEFNLKMVQLSSGQEWRRPELAEASKSAFIVPLNFPEIPKLPEEDDWLDVSLDQLRAWDWAPENAAVLRKRGLEVALTTRGLSDKKNFRKNLRLAVDRGLSEPDAIAALTTVPAKLCGLDNKLGTIAAGKIANLTVVENDGYLAATNKVTDVWVAGEVFRVNLPEEKKAADEKKDSKTAETDKETKERDEKKAAERRELMIKRIAKAPSETRGPLATPKAVIIKNATIWTSGPEGILQGADVVFAEGKVKGVGHDVKVEGDALVIDGTGKHVTPGLIDCHSHSVILGSVNEGTLPSSAMVRIGDVVNSETRNIEEELAGGLTMANLLHGSANPIGGQNCVIKLRDGAAPEELKFEGAPPGIKFALGENVKQSNWGDNARTRFPQSRMGVPVFMRNRFQAARAYAEAMRQAPDKTRRDVELDAIVEIIEGKRLVHCHSYRQDEIVAFLRVMEEFGVKVATLQHVLEGYKIADEMAKHGVGGSTFSDWFNYKYEVIDAIPYNGSLMRERGVVVSFNSDSSDLSRRLYTEAAKAVKYGGTSEEEALKFVTINPAKQLRIDSRVGSIEPGKDADFVIWSKSPLDSGTVCLETWIDGKKYFDRSAVPERMTSLQKERTDLLAKAKQAAGLKGSERSEGAEAKFFELPLELQHEHNRHCDDE